MDSPIHKRRRIALACDACRLRKSRCNGEHPRCSSCIGLGVVCQYEPTNSASNVLVRKEYLSDLEDRVAANERKIQQVDQLLRSHLSRQTNGQQDALPSIPGENSYHAEDLEEPRDEDAATNGMAMTFLEEHTSAFFGESSNLSFTRFLFRSTAAISQPLSTAQASLDTFPVDKSRPRPTPGSPTQPNDVITTLPSAEAMEKMLNLYFDHPGLVFPFVHESTMRQQYADFKANGFSRARRTWLGLLNMIFALASRFDVSSDLMPGLNQSEVSDTFHKRAKSLCGRLSTRVVSLEIIQYLILEVIHCQGMQRSTQAWNIFGLLVRSAIALGLHGTHKRLDLITAESYRRTWLVIYGLDRLLSMVFGRPMAIVDEQMAILSPIESSIGEPADIMDLAGCFLTASSHLYQIMGMSLVKQYGANVDHARNDVDELALLQASEEVRQALRTWMAKLPACLGICHSQSEMLLESTKANRLRVILTLRYHNLNLLIHRPLLSASLRHLSKQDVPGYTLQLARAGASACVQSAVATIDVVHSIVNADPTSRSNLGIWFFTLYYVFTASLVMCSELLLAKHGQVCDENSVAHAKAMLDKSNTIFQKLNHDDTLVYSCSQYIRNLSELYISRAKTSIENGAYPSSQPIEGLVNDIFPFMPDTLGIMNLNAEDVNEFLASEMIDPSIFEGF